MEQAWNEYRGTVSLVVPTEESELAHVLCIAINACSAELQAGCRFHASADGRFVTVALHDREPDVEQSLIGVCNKKAQGGGLAKQIEEFLQRAGKLAVVVVRSTAYPSNPKTAVAQMLEKLTADGGRRVVVEDSDWRTMLAFEGFQQRHAADEAFASWQVQTRPLTSLDSLRAILDLDRPSSAASPAHSLMTQD